MKFVGALLGFIFTTGVFGIGYYRDELRWAFLQLLLNDLTPCDSFAAGVSRSWGCIDDDPCLSPPGSQEQSSGDYDDDDNDDAERGTAHGVAFVRRRDTRDGVAFISFNPNARSSFESFLATRRRLLTFDQLASRK